VVGVGFGGGGGHRCKGTDSHRLVEPPTLTSPYSSPSPDGPEPCRGTTRTRLVLVELWRSDLLPDGATPCPRSHAVVVVRDRPTWVPRFLWVPFPAGVWVWVCGGGGGAHTP
jgi:hypothetical protein